MDRHPSIAPRLPVFELEKESTAYRALCMLVDVGGQWAIKRLRNAFYAENTNGFSNFSVNVTHKLQDLRFVTADRTNMTVTTKGRDYVAAVRRAAPKSQEYVGIVATPNLYDRMRCPGLVYNLSLAGDRRPGALDYRKYPSLQAGVRKLPSGEIIE